MVALEPAADARPVRYVNRLSDLLFVLARVVNRRAPRSSGDAVSLEIRSW